MLFGSNFIFSFLAVSLEKGADGLEGEAEQHTVPPGTGASFVLLLFFLSVTSHHVFVSPALAPIDQFQERLLTEN